MKRIKPQHFLILLLVAALAAAPFLIRGLIDRLEYIVNKKGPGKESFLGKLLK